MGEDVARSILEREREGEVLKAGLLWIVRIWISFLKRLRRLDVHLRRHAPLLFALRGDWIVGMAVIAWPVVFICALIRIIYPIGLDVAFLGLLVFLNVCGVLIWAMQVILRFDQIRPVFRSIRHYGFWQLCLAAAVIVLPAFLALDLIAASIQQESGLYVLAGISVMLGLLVILISIQIHVRISESFNVFFADLDSLSPEVRVFTRNVAVLGVTFIACLLASSSSIPWWEKNSFEWIYDLARRFAVFPLERTVLVFYFVELVLCAASTITIVLYWQDARESGNSAWLRRMQSVVVGRTVLLGAIVAQALILISGPSQKNLSAPVMIGVASLLVLGIDQIYRRGDRIIMGPRS
ncbi:hypothetical protein [Bradyrhizobium sp. Y36]|uniref:hypothetical protein n=1 Tax=Bradyrhizobium sp. Y36 TaxID=2035447 RepID=UPI0011784834|nr:hypothetical protein [Bradyrhizobium sp. Y36]